MAGQDDRFSEPKRESRQFQPAVDTALERREVPATLAALPLGNAAGLANSKLVGAARAGKTVATTDWNSVAGWSFLQGVWKSSTRIDFMQAIAKSMGARSVHFPSVPSLDTWLASDNQFVGRTALAAQQKTSMPLDGLVIKPGGSTGVTTLSMTSADGTPPVEMTLTASDSKSATFTGTTMATTTSTSTTTDPSAITSTSTSTDTTTTPAPVQVTVTRRNNNTLRITAEIQTSGQWVRMFTYTATRTKYAVG